MIKTVDTKEATRYYNTNVFWIITLIFIGSFKLFYNIDNVIIHNIFLPIILFTSGLCIVSLLLGNLLFIKRNNKFNSTIKIIKNKFSENEFTSENIIKELNILKIPYICTDYEDIISPISICEKILNKLQILGFYISLCIGIIVFIYSYYNSLIL